MGFIVGIVVFFIVMGIIVFIGTFISGSSLSDHSYAPEDTQQDADCPICEEDDFDGYNCMSCGTNPATGEHKDYPEELLSFVNYMDEQTHDRDQS